MGLFVSVCKNRSCRANIDWFYSAPDSYRCSNCGIVNNAFDIERSFHTYQHYWYANDDCLRFIKHKITEALQLDPKLNIYQVFGEEGVLFVDSLRDKPQNLADRVLADIDSGIIDPEEIEKRHGNDGLVFFQNVMITKDIT